MTTHAYEWARRLPLEFYQRDVHAVARDLLGRHLCRFENDELRVGRIVEVEAYGGAPDPACHGDSGVPTDRTRPMFGPGGVAYVYRIYGMYDCFNVVTAPTELAAAVLVRAAEPVAGLELMAAGRGHEPPRTQRQTWNLMSGPGKLCQAMSIRRDDHDGLALDRQWLFISDGEPAADDEIQNSARIGLNPNTVGDSAEWEWRYTLATSEFVSR